MTLKERFATLGKLSPFITAASYVAVLLLVNAVAGLWPQSILAALFVLVVWLAASVCFFIVVAWYRDEDWLLSGFLLGVPAMLGGILSVAVVQAVTLRSIGPIVVAAPTAFLALLTRGIFIVPLAGGAVALARIISRRWKSGVA